MERIKMAAPRKWLEAEGFAPVVGKGKVAGVYREWVHPEGRKAIVGFGMARREVKMHAAGGGWAYYVEVG